MKNKVFEESSKKIKILSGSFLEGCGVMVKDLRTNNFHHLLVLRDKKDGKLFVEIGNKQYFEEDIEGR